MRKDVKNFNICSQTKKRHESTMGNKHINGLQITYKGELGCLI